MVPIATLSEFANLADARGDGSRAIHWRGHAARLQVAVEAEGWDGAWYRRAYFDDGSPFGSAANAECRIDSIAQSWGVISGVAEDGRARRAMHSVGEYLSAMADRPGFAVHPPFDKTDRDPGYIKCYPPGVRENGGQYTHAVWSAIAYAMLGGGQAAELCMLNPIRRAATRTGAYLEGGMDLPVRRIYAEPPRHGVAGGHGTPEQQVVLPGRYRMDIQASVSTTAKWCSTLHSHAWTAYSIAYQHQDTRYEDLR